MFSSSHISWVFSQRSRPRVIVIQTDLSYQPAVAVVLQHSSCEKFCLSPLPHSAKRRLTSGKRRTVLRRASGTSYPPIITATPDTERLQLALLAYSASTYTDNSRLPPLPDRKS